MLKKYTCIMCPLGCDLEVKTGEDQTIEVTGNSCKKGLDYARQEILNPMRNIATSVIVEGGSQIFASVRLTNAIPRERIFDAMEEIKKIKIQAPVTIGQVIIGNILGLNSDVIITKNVDT